MSIEETLKKIRRHHMSAMQTEVRDAETRHYREVFPDLNIESVYREKCVNVVNDMKLKWSYDQYLNGTYSWESGRPSVKYVQVFADLILRHEQTIHPDHMYLYRVVQGLYIDLARDFQEQWEPEDLLELLKQADKLPTEGKCELKQSKTGFRAWLLTRSYVCEDGGAVENILQRRGIDFRMKFKDGLAVYEATRGTC